MQLSWIVVIMYFEYNTRYYVRGALCSTCVHRLTSARVSAAQQLISTLRSAFPVLLRYMLNILPVCT